MSKSGFNCPKCNSWDTEYIWGATEIECNTCGHVFDPGDDDVANYSCPRCGSHDLDIDEDGSFECNECGVQGDVDYL